MSMKVIAIGNTLMEDDAIAIEVARKIEEELLEKGIEVIYGETDFEYCISMVREEDYIFILDAAHFGKEPGKVTFLPINNFVFNKTGYTQHSYSFLDLLKLFYPDIQGVICAVEIHEVECGYGLSPRLQEKLKDISQEILSKIYSAIGVNK